MLDGYLVFVRCVCIVLPDGGSVEAYCQADPNRDLMGSGKAVHRTKHR